MSKIVAGLFRDSLKVGYTKIEEVTIGGLTFAGVGIVIWAMATYSSASQEMFMTKVFLATALFALSLMLTIFAMKRRIKQDNKDRR